MQPRTAGRLLVRLRCAALPYAASFHASRCGTTAVRQQRRFATPSPDDAVIQVDQYVRVQDRTEAWQYGRVTAVEDGVPLVRVDGFQGSYPFSRVAPAQFVPAPTWLSVGDRVSCAGEPVSIDRIDDDGVSWATADAWSSTSKLVAHSVSPLEESLLRQAWFLLTHPTRALATVRNEGPACVLLYFALRVPLATVVALLGLALHGYIVTGLPRSALASALAGAYVLGHLSRPFCLLLALTLARRGNLTQRLRTLVGWKPRA